MEKGYLVATVTVVDAAGYEEYRRAVPEVIERHGGRYLVRGGELDRLENAADMGRLVVIEFGTLEAARRFYHSEAYAPLRAMRERTTRSTVVIVTGYVGG